MNKQLTNSGINIDLSTYFNKSERIALFIDGVNLYRSIKGLQFEIDYGLLRDTFSHCGNMIRAYYYTAILDDNEYSSVRPLADWLDYNGFTLKSKPAREYTDGFGRRIVKGDMDVELAVDALEIAPHIEHAVLFSGDGDFRALVEALQRQAVKVTVISTMRTDPPMIADDLRRQADQYIELSALRHLIARPPRGEHRDKP